MKSDWQGKSARCSAGRRIREAAKLGFKTVLIPTANKPKQGIDGVTILTVDRVDDALAILREQS